MSNTATTAIVAVLYLKITTTGAQVNSLRITAQFNNVSQQRSSEYY